MINQVTNACWEDVIHLIGNQQIDLVVSDPPFGMEYQSNRRQIKYNAIENDNNLDWLPSWCKELSRVCKPDAHLYIFCSWHNIEVFKTEIQKFFQVKNILIWEKNNHGSGDLEGDYAPKYEMIIFCSNGQKKLNGKRHPNIIKANRTQNDLHPTEKPVNLIRFLIEKSSEPNDLVLDTFAGSFTTAKACIESRRRFICIEKETHHCKTGNKRLQGTTAAFF